MKNTLGFLKLNDRLHADFYNMTEQEMEQLFWDTDFEPIDELTYDGYFTNYGMKSCGLNGITFQPKQK